MDGITLAQVAGNATSINSLYLVGAVLLAFVLFLLTRRQPKHVRAYSTENGEVIVKRAAIVELVQTSCEQIKEVSKPQVRMRVKGGQTHFEVRLKLASGGQLRAIEEMLQAHLRKALTENLGIEHLGHINIVATGFKSSRLDASSSIAKKQRAATEAAEAEQAAAPEADENSDSEALNR